LARILTLSPFLFCFSNCLIFCKFPTFFFV
jgi:hypothetical protein